MVLLTEIGDAITDETRRAIEEVRTLGLLLRYGFSWEDGAEKPTQDTTLLDVFVQSEFKLASPSKSFPTRSSEPMSAFYVLGKEHGHSRYSWPPPTPLVPPSAPASSSQEILAPWSH